MEKNIDGYYELYTIWGDGTEYSVEDGIYLKAENNKIVDCIEPKYYNGVDTERMSNGPSYYLEEKLEKVVGENIKDFILDSIKTNTIINYHDECVECVSFKPITEEHYIKSKNLTYATEEEMKAHDQRVAAILQSKENKATLGKTGVMDKIATMKTGRSGK